MGSKESDFVMMLPLAVVKRTEIIIDAVFENKEKIDYILVKQ